MNIDDGMCQIQPRKFLPGNVDSATSDGCHWFTPESCNNDSYINNPTTNIHKSTPIWPIKFLWWGHCSQNKNETNAWRKYLPTVTPPMPSTQFSGARFILSTWVENLQFEQLHCVE